MEEITLICWNCGNHTNVTIEGNIAFGFELAKIATDAGLIGAFDMNRGRVLVFCNQECADKQRTKKGYFRLRPLKIKAAN